jgi:flavin-dependent dehydrogenase
MEELLPSAVFQKLSESSVNCQTGSPDKLAIIDGRTGKTTAVVGEEYSFIRANRQALRQVLRDGVNVQIGKEFTHYETTPSGDVIAYFADGTTAKGSLIVGADGSRSRGTFDRHLSNFTSRQNTS